jgi:hypothetical protein
MRQFEADIAAFQTDLRVQMTLEAMQQLARYLSGIPGRKNLIWFSGSFPIALDPDDTQQDPFEAMRNYSDQIRETAELLSAARVAVYPVTRAAWSRRPRSMPRTRPPPTSWAATANGNRTTARRSVTANKPSTEQRRPERQQAAHGRAGLHAADCRADRRPAVPQHQRIARGDRQRH